MERICFRWKLKLESIDEYVLAHQNVWPKLLTALSESGWNNYSLFLNREDGSLIGYVEVENFEKALSRIADYEVNTLWQNEMVKYFHTKPGLTPAQSMDQFAEVFHLQ